MDEIDKALGLGKTGDFPQGKLDETDEGALRMAIGIENRCVVVRFGTPTAWIGLDAAGARALADSLIRKADELELTNILIP